MPLKLG